MSHEYVLWIATTAYALHMIEETVYDWHGWVRRVLKLQAEWHEFYVVNAFVIVLGASCAMVGWRCPEMALSFPAFMLVNAVLFHIVPAAVTRVFSPGLFTAVVLFLPVAGWAYYGAWQDGALTAASGAASGALGLLMMFFPIVLQVTKRRAFFRQDIGGSDYPVGRPDAEPGAAADGGGMSAFPDV